MNDETGDKLSYESYTVAVVCAMSFEMSAVRYMLDREHPRLQRKEGDSNIYVLGQLYGHNIVLACLPGDQGKGSAATVATNLARTFPAIALRFLVGIGGGIPSEKHDIRLGDVVVSMPSGQYGGVVQYDLGKKTDCGFILKGFLQHPPPLLRSAVETMRSDHFVMNNKIEEFITLMLQKGPRLSVYQRPSTETDVLFNNDYAHESNQPTCDKCDRQEIVPRIGRFFSEPEIHYGLIASGDSVVRSSNSAAVEYLGDVLCFEMEAAGLMTEFSYLVIRGISDYADSHKNDTWHYHAAATAAACTKELLSYIQPAQAASWTATSSVISPTGGNGLTPNSVSHFSGKGIQHSGSGTLSIGGDFNIG